MADTSDSRQIFIFELDGEEYGTQVENVREIIKASDKEVTEVPNAPDFIRGITNVRGQVVPLIDLEEKFDISQRDNEFIVIVELNDTSAGLMVDNVHEVMRVKEKRIKDAPEILDQEIHREYVQNVVILEDRMIIILDLLEGLEDHEAVAVEKISDEMGSDEEEQEEENLSDEKVEEMAKQRVKNSGSSDSDSGSSSDSGSGSGSSSSSSSGSDSSSSSGSSSSSSSS